MDLTTEDIIKQYQKAKCVEESPAAPAKLPEGYHSARTPKLRMANAGIVG